MITTCRGLCTTGRERNTRSTYEPQKGQKDVLRSSFLCILCSELCFLCSFPVPLCKARLKAVVMVCVVVLGRGAANESSAAPRLMRLTKPVPRPSAVATLFRRYAAAKCN